MLLPFIFCFECNTGVDYKYLRKINKYVIIGNTNI